MYEYDVLTSCVDQPSPFVSAGIGLTDDGHQLPFSQVQVQVSAGHHRADHLVDFSRTVFIGELLQTALRRRAQRLRVEKKTQERVRREKTG